MKYIELFAGCGGLSLGLDAVGFDLVMANELSPMAAQTFAYNLLNEDLENSTNHHNRVKWLASNYPLAQMPKRLREDPRNFPKDDFKFTDLMSGNLEKKQLIIGNICHLNEWLANNKHNIEQLQTSFGEATDLDLISGGPPCQSFSLAGLRQLNNHRNNLPWEFAKFVNLVKPKIVLLENVAGILMPFEEADQKYYAWYEVAKVFAKINYVPLCLHINAKYVGAAQNRPRFILLALRVNFYESIKNNLSSLEGDLLIKSYSFYKELTQKNDVDYGLLDVIDVENRVDFTKFSETFLKPLVCNIKRINTVKDAIDDLHQSKKNTLSQYVNNLNCVFLMPDYIKYDFLKNHDYRSNSTLIKQRFRIYQVLNQVTKTTKKEAKLMLKGSISVLSNTASTELLKYGYFYNGQTDYFFGSKLLLEDFLKAHITKKQTQKALVADQPAPAALSIPDDICHYHENELRTLTVREMARIQSFPDWFEFKSKVTTGGKMREFEVPQYTQVGNAVPPLLGFALGLVVKNLLNKKTKIKLQVDTSKSQEKQLVLV